MKYNKIINTKYFGTLVLFLSICATIFTSCETTDLDINIDPNQLSPESADKNFVLNDIQLGFANQSFNLSANSRGIMRHINMRDTYAANSVPAAMNFAWSSTYQITANRQFLERLNETSSIANHVGVAQLLEAYAFVNLVDFIGTAAYSEANNPEINAPKLDSGEEIYNDLYNKIDSAISNLSVTGQDPFEDIFYNGDLNKWIKLANTLKLRMYVQTKLVGNSSATASVNSILASGNYIKSSEDDFIFQYGSQNARPDARHPDYIANYVTGANTYMSNEFMNIMLNEKSIADPRLRYYIYRQQLEDPVNTDDNVILPCEGNPVYTLCYIGEGYWGRMHADDEGIPNDNQGRSTFGVYPAGGAFDEGINNTSTLVNAGIGGAGIYPILTSSFVNFLIAEATLPSPVGLGATGNTLSYLEAGMSDSFTKVANFAGKPMDAADLTTYYDEVTALFNAATSDEARLSIIMKELYLASFGNSIESYNGYRRTGYPNDLGGSVINQTDFPRNFLIPESELNSNDNPDLEQITRVVQIFWDTNPAGFIE
ncbi:SusD/RagB family nutrient-binding outer membrane lipoprotein [Tenacibaculum sp. SG-28]|uniref:SusD/RagB family nutrient-binding outer membrane lipoprotein n=1 Tax=Tenacibaculum sp. SG-28 TaxID=754426 RepID=UPI000CF56C9C|nr:SusD/RagB family nutrient-binding outer membrane lipoprotein [Tenacibaculum sp. SG-28]PQJ22988.1 hypothetical protein BSU00_01550 [Tenacibaculum sp. SG-28]